MNENQRRKNAEMLVMDCRKKRSELPEPDQTYAVEMDMALEIGRLKEDIVEQRYSSRYE